MGDYVNKNNNISKSDIDFDPMHFLRCHSRKNDSADHQTEVWMCAFEPDPDNPGKTTNLIATCGGNIICFIDVRYGDLASKYICTDHRELFYTLAWTTLPNRDSLLVCGGSRNVMHFINRADFSSYLQFSVDTKSRTSRIQGLLFHPKQFNLLFCGTSNGNIGLYDIGNPMKPHYNTDIKTLTKFSVESEIFSLAFCSITKILLAGCNDGLRGVYIDDVNEYPKQPSVLTFKLPLSDKNQTEELVDSVELLQDGVIAAKCALQGCFYIWHLPSTVGDMTNCKTTTFNVAPTHLLHWSNTDNYFMYAGYHMGPGLLACGDDEGSIWLYDLQKLDFLHRNEKPIIVKPVAIIQWPTLADSSTDKKHKLQLAERGKDIVIDKVAVDCTGNYIVAVTNNNVVCIWQRS